MESHWNGYVSALKATHVRIVDKEDELVWKHVQHDRYTLKMGYIQLNILVHQRDPLWWWKGLWKLKCPQKAKLFMWCVITNKIPTWNRMKRRTRLVLSLQK